MRSQRMGQVSAWVGKFRYALLQRCGRMVSQCMDTGCEGVNHSGHDGYRAYLGGVALAVVCFTSAHKYESKDRNE